MRESEEELGRKRKTGGWQRGRGGMWQICISWGGWEDGMARLFARVSGMRPTRCVDVLVGDVYVRERHLGKRDQVDAREFS